VASFADRSPRRHRVDPVAYGALRRDVIAACRAMAEASHDEGRRAYYEGLEGLVVPWLAPKSLEKADGEILGSLLERCRRAERELGGRGPRTFALVPILGAALGAMAAAGGLALLPAAGVDPVPMVGQVRDWSDSAWLAVKYSTDTQRIAAAAVGVMAVSVRFILRTAHT
jgi:hypothetical protein